MATKYYRTKIVKNGKVTYKYPNEASRKYYEGKGKTSSKKAPALSSQYLWELRNYGRQFVINKYGKAYATKMSEQIDAAFRNPGRAGAESDSKGKKVKVRIGDGFDYRVIGNSQLNKAPKPRDGEWLKSGARLGFGDGKSENGPVPSPTQALRTLQLNLENDSGAAHGYHHPWAQTSSVSSLISGLLRQSQTSGQDYMNTWAANKSGTLSMGGGESSNWGINPTYTPSSLSASQPMGAFGTNTVMNNNSLAGLPEEEEEAAPDEAGNAGDISGDKYDLTQGSDPLDAVSGESGVYNPWSRIEGGEYNQYGPNQGHLAQSTMEAMALANAYFAPQRLEMAYQLGEMETDMRRLAANLGREGDDPTLQAMLYKESMRAVRALDVQQNTMAFQMSDARRREEIQNFQFYDQLAQQEAQLKLANRQFYENLDLQKRYYNLQNYQVSNFDPTVGSGGAAPSAGAPSSTAGANEDVYGGNIYGLRY